MDYTLIEPCCGSAALTMHLLGAKRAILPYQGSKWRFRKQLAAQMAALGFQGPPARVVLTDPGPWGKALGIILDPAARPALIRCLQWLSRRDPLEVYQRLHRGPVHISPVKYAAEFLFLQRLSFSGKAVGETNGNWDSPGFNTSSAYGLAPTDRFGHVNPMVPSMIRVFQDYDLLPAEIIVSMEPARPPAARRKPTWRWHRTVVYIDPAYAGSTRYPGGTISPDEVSALATAYRKVGATVMVSERIPLWGRGWNHISLHAGKDNSSPFRGKHEEWVTFGGPDDRR